MRQKVLECLAEPLSTAVATHMVAKWYTLLSVALIETHPSCMPAIDKDAKVKKSFHTQQYMEKIIMAAHAMEHVPYF